MSEHSGIDQCDQIGLLLVTNYISFVAQILSSFLGYFVKWPFQVKPSVGFLDNF